MGIDFLAAVETDGVNSGEPCGVLKLLAQLDQPLKGQVAEAINERRDLTGAAIARQLVALGYEVSEATITRHRRGACKCRSLTK